ncbi:MAG TPA: hypothetical protein VNU44_05390 [Bryobacteraceae bacterium]|jgi:hypothetical protein|nr:hypothetical protein [Bryobacteraceae bacterium]
MDQDLKQHLEAMESRMVTLMTEVKESLERQMHTGFEDVATRFETQGNRLDRQAALIQTGSRWTNRMNDWAERVDIALDKKDLEISELRDRLKRIEDGGK